jgi:5-hydroxyisourate hydrolase
VSTISTHVLDTSRGWPAAGVRVGLYRVDDAGVVAAIGGQDTDADGRARALVEGGRPIPAGRYRLVFETGAYHRSLGAAAFFPTVTIDIEIEDPSAHYHVPLLLSPFGYTTYRGS